MCEICNNIVTRNYTHCRNKHHYRLLLEIMQYKKKSNYYLIAYEERAKILPNIV